MVLVNVMVPQSETAEFQLEPLEAGDGQGGENALTPGEGVAVDGELGGAVSPALPPAGALPATAPPPRGNGQPPIPRQFASCAGALEPQAEAKLRALDPTIAVIELANLDTQKRHPAQPLAYLGADAKARARQLVGPGLVYFSIDPGNGQSQWGFTLDLTGGGDAPDKDAVLLQLAAAFSGVVEQQKKFADELALIRAGRNQEMREWQERIFGFMGRAMDATFTRMEQAASNDSPAQVIAKQLTGHKELMNAIQEAAGDSGGDSGGGSILETLVGKLIESVGPDAISKIMNPGDAHTIAAEAAARAGGAV